MKDYLRPPSDEFKVCSLASLGESQFVPSVEELRALSAIDMSNQCLTHVLHRSGCMHYFSLKFSNGSISPGSYKRTPAVEEVEEPVPDHPGYIIFKTCKPENFFFLYSMEMQSLKQETMCVIMPADKSYYHHETHQVTLKQGERVVAARIDVDKEDKYLPCVI